MTDLQKNFQAGVDGIYDAIVARGTTPASKSLSDVKASISTLSNTSDATAAAGHILSGKTAYVNGSKVTGSMANYSGQWRWANSDNGGGFGVSTYAWSSGGTTDMVYAYIKPGYVDSGTKIILDTKSTIASYLIAGKSLFGVSGTATSDANASAEYIAYGKTAYVNGSKITGKLTNYNGSYMLGNINIISTNTGGPSNIVRMSYSVPSSSSGFYVPSNSSFFLYADKSVLGDAVASSVLSGSTFTSSSGLKLSGTMRNAASKQSGEAGLNSSYPGIPVLYASNPQVNTATDGNRIFSICPATGYYQGGGAAYSSVKLSTLASALGITASKIASGQTICDVTGTYTGGYKYYKAEIPYSSGTWSGVTLKEGIWVNFCSSSNDSTFTFYHNLGLDTKSIAHASLSIVETKAGIRSGRSSGGTTDTGIYKYQTHLDISADYYSYADNGDYYFYYMDNSNSNESSGSPNVHSIFVFIYPNRVKVEFVYNKRNTFSVKYYSTLKFYLSIVYK